MLNLQKMGIYSQTFYFSMIDNVQYCEGMVKKNFFRLKRT